MSVSKNTIQKLDHHAGLRDMTSQTYPSYVCTGSYNARHFIGSLTTFCCSWKHGLLK